MGDNRKTELDGKLPKTKGDISEFEIVVALLRKGYGVSKALLSDQKYDLIVDDGKKLWRAQCKTGRLVKGCVDFRLVSVHSHVRGGHRVKTYKGTIDVFLVYCPDNDQTYWIPIEECGSTHCYLRIEKEKAPGGPKKKLAKDYEVRPCRSTV